MTASNIPFSAQGRRALAPTIARLMSLALESPGLLSLAAGFTDNGSLPLPEVSELVRELALAGNPEVLQYGTNHGRAGLRRLVSARLLQQDPDAGDLEELAASCLITNGSQQALYLAMQVLCDAGDIVLVDRPSYFVYLEMLKGLGVQARSLPVDEQGRLDADSLERLLDSLIAAGQRPRLKAVYFVSYFSNPSSRSLCEEDKVLLANALRRRGILLPVIEDAAYRELYFETPYAARSVLGLAAWEGFPRLYLSTMTKSFSTGLKIGYGFCTDAAWLSRMLHIKGHQDFGSSNFAQAICEKALETGLFERQLSRIRALYARKMQALSDALEQEGLRELGWTWSIPTGGLYLWLTAPDAWDTRMESVFCQTCLAEGVLYVPGELCHGDAAPTNTVRLSYGVLAEDLLRKAAARFATAVRLEQKRLLRASEASSPVTQG